MQPLDTGKNKWLFCLGVSVCAIVLTVWPNASIDLRYDRTALESGQWWRAVTGHMVHLNIPHLLLNLFGLFLVCELLWRDFPWRHACVLLFFSAMGISGLLWFFHPGLAWYAGLSGSLHSLWAGCALAGWWSVQPFAGDAAAVTGVDRTRSVFPRYLFSGALILLASKLILETIFGPPLHAERTIGAPVIYIAHIYGALTGMIYVSIWRGIAGLWRRK